MRRPRTTGAVAATTTTTTTTRGPGMDGSGTQAHAGSRAGNHPLPPCLPPSLQHPGLPAISRNGRLERTQPTTRPTARGLAISRVFLFWQLGASLSRRPRSEPVHQSGVTSLPFTPVFSPEHVARHEEEEEEAGFPRGLAEEESQKANMPGAVFILHLSLHPWCYFFWRTFTFVFVSPQLVPCPLSCPFSCLFLG